MFVLMISRSSSIMGWVWSKSRSLGQILEKLVYTLGTTFLAKFSSNLVRMFVLMISWSSLIMGWEGSKSRSLGQILEISCFHSRDHIFGQIFIKLGKNVGLDDISVKCDHGWGRVKK